MNPLDWIPEKYKLLAIALLVVAAALAVVGYGEWRHAAGVTEGKTEKQAEWTADNLKREEATLNEERAHAREGVRRLEAQQENQRVQNEQLAAAHAAADRNRADADQLRGQNADTARRWRDALADSPTRADLAAAGDTIGMLADLLGRSDRRAGVLAQTADTRGAAGLKCERDYDALSPPK